MPKHKGKMEGDQPPGCLPPRFVPSRMEGGDEKCVEEGGCPEKEMLLAQKNSNGNSKSNNNIYETYSGQRKDLGLQLATVSLVPIAI